MYRCLNSSIPKPCGVHSVKLSICIERNPQTLFNIFIGTKDLSVCSLMLLRKQQIILFNWIMSKIACSD